MGIFRDIDIPCLCKKYIYNFRKKILKTGKSKTMNSYHLKRLAIDLNFFKPVYDEDGKLKGYTLTWRYEDIKPFGEYWESLNPKNKWGGNFKTFKDTPHFERRV